MATTELAFALYGRPAGLITRRGGSLRLTYDAAYAQSPDATPLSVSMPVGIGDSWGNRFVEAHLRGLLPDHAEVRARWAAHSGVRDRDTLGLLAAIGTDVAGGAVFAPPAQLDEVLERPGGWEPVPDAWIARRLRDLRSDPAAWHEDEDHWSLAGGQAKFTLALHRGRWGVTTGAAPSTHIVKPGIGHIPAQGLTEHVSMRALALAGLDVAASSFRLFEDQPALVVERFDRRTTPGGQVLRIHQEDLLQALALDPTRKYEDDRGPTLQTIANLLRTHLDDDGIRSFATQVIANTVLGAPDAHAKNYGLLLAGPTVKLTPAYDVSSGLMGDATGHLRYRTYAHAIGGERRIGEVAGRHWDRFARLLGLDPTWVRTRVADLAMSLPRGFARALDELDPSTPGLDTVGGVVLPRVKALAERTLELLDDTHTSTIAPLGSRAAQTFLDTLDSTEATASDGAHGSSTEGAGGFGFDAGV